LALLKRLVVAAVVVLVLFGTGIASHFRPAGPHLTSLAAAVGLSFFSIAGGYLANRWAFGRSPKLFMGTLVGGMAARLLVIALVLIWIVKNLQIPLVTFFIALSVSYLTFEIVEVWTIHQNLKRGKV